MAGVGCKERGGEIQVEGAFLGRIWDRFVNRPGAKREAPGVDKPDPRHPGRHILELTRPRGYLDASERGSTMPKSRPPHPPEFLRQ